MAWCHQTTSHYLNHCWANSMTPYGVTRPQWVSTELVMRHCLYQWWWWPLLISAQFLYKAHNTWNGQKAGDHLLCSYEFPIHDTIWSNLYNTIHEQIIMNGKGGEMSKIYSWTLNQISNVLIKRNMVKDIWKMDTVPLLMSGLSQNGLCWDRT